MRLSIIFIIIAMAGNVFQYFERASVAKQLEDVRSDIAQAQVAKTLCQGALDTQSGSIREWQKQAEAMKDKAAEAMKSAQVEVDRQAEIIDNLRRTPAKTCDEVRQKMERDALND